MTRSLSVTASLCPPAHRTGAASHRRLALITPATEITFCVRGVISPLLSNVYLDEVDRMLEKAKEVTRLGDLTAMEYSRFADDLVILVGSFHRFDWLLK